jgi:hypothetical protein
VSCATFVSWLDRAEGDLKLAGPIEGCLSSHIGERGSDL